MNWEPYFQVDYTSFKPFRVKCYIHLNLHHKCNIHTHTVTVVHNEHTQSVIQFQFHCTKLPKAENIFEEGGERKVG